MTDPAPSRKKSRKKTREGWENPPPPKNRPQCTALKLILRGHEVVRRCTLEASHGEFCVTHKREGSRQVAVRAVLRPDWEVQQKHIIEVLKQSFDPTEIPDHLLYPDLLRAHQVVQAPAPIPAPLGLPDESVWQEAINSRVGRPPGPNPLAGMPPLESLLPQLPAEPPNPLAGGSVGERWWEQAEGD